MPTRNPPPAVILVVDDEPAVTRLLSRYLTQLGYRVVEASSGEQALAAIGLRRPRIDLVLSDIMMPEMDGVELAAAVLAKCPGPSVLLMTGQLPGEVKHIDVAGRIVPLLRKPMNFEELRELLQVTLEGYPPEVEAGSAH